MKNIDSFSLNSTGRNFDAFARFKKNEEAAAAKADKKSKKKKDKRSKSPEFPSVNLSTDLLEMQQVENLIRQAQAQPKSRDAYDDQVFTLLRSVPEVEPITLEVLDEFHGGRFDATTDCETVRNEPPRARKPAVVQKVRFERVD